MEPIGRIRRAVTRRPLVSSLVGVLALATAVSVPVAAASGGGGASASVAMVGYAPAIPSAAVRTGGVAPATSIRFEFLLRLPDAASLQAFATGVSTPGSPLFHHYLARGEVGRRFGPTSATVSAVSAGLRKLGLTPGSVSPDHLLLAVTAPAAKIESTLHTSLVRYRMPNGHVGFANASTPMLPVSLARDVTAVIGLDTVAQWHPELARVRSKSSSKRVERPSDSSAPSPSSGAASPLAPASTARSSVRPDLASPDTAGPTPCSTASTDAGNSGTYTADQIASAYGHNTLYSRGDLGSGETIGIFSFQSYIANDLKAYETCYGITTPVSTVAVDGGAGTCTSASCEDEDILDLEDTVGLAPDAHVINYSAPNGEDVDLWDVIVDSDIAQVVSTSWGICEAEADGGTVSFENTIFQMAAAQGQSLFDAAGDDGSEDCYDSTTPSTTSQLAVDDPGGQPYITVVGGTTLSALGSPPTTQPTQSVWNDGPASSPNAAGAGGGGISTNWPMPAWQHGTGVSNKYSSGTPCQATSGDCRETPDLSADADPETGYELYYGGAWANGVGNGGTSAASPTVASLISLSDESCGRRVGFISPTLYNLLAAGKEGTDFNDIKTGNNDYTGTHAGAYPATTGYDMASGIGSPIGGPLSTDLCSGASYPTGVAINSTGATAYVADAGTNEVNVITTSTNASTATVNVGAYPDALALSPSGSALYVSNYKGNSVSKIATSGNTVTTPITGLSKPTGIAVTPNGDTLFVADSGSGKVSVINTATNAVSGTIAVGGEPTGLAVSSSGADLLVANASLHTLDLYSTASPYALLSTATLPAGSEPANVAITGTAPTAYVAEPGKNAVGVVVFTTPASPTISSVTVGTRPYGVAIVPTKNEVVATNSEGGAPGDACSPPADPPACTDPGGSMSVISTPGDTVTTTVATGLAPDGVAAAPSGAFAIVANEGSGTDSKIVP